MNPGIPFKTTAPALRLAGNLRRGANHKTKKKRITRSQSNVTSTTSQILPAKRLRLIAGMPARKTPSTIMRGKINIGGICVNSAEVSGVNTPTAIAKYGDSKNPASMMGKNIGKKADPSPNA